jgi:hypothetical protein
MAYLVPITSHFVTVIVLSYTTGVYNILWYGPTTVIVDWLADCTCKKQS